MNKKAKLTVFGIIALFGLLLLGAWIGRQREAVYDAYAAANNCEWQYQGTAYGDNRDFICK